MDGSKHWVGLAVVLVLTGCSEDGGKAPEDRDHVMDEQVEAIDKARDVEQTLDEAYQRRRHELDQDTR